jgi:hypothetical protein
MTESEQALEDHLKWFELLSGDTRELVETYYAEQKANWFKC